MELDNDNMEADVAEFAALLRKEGNKSYRRYRLSRKDGRLVLRRDELDRRRPAGEQFGPASEPSVGNGCDRPPLRSCVRQLAGSDPQEQVRLLVCAY
jgi:hypothetical protein